MEEKTLTTEEKKVINRNKIIKKLCSPSRIERGFERGCRGCPNQKRCEDYLRKYDDEQREQTI